MTKPKKKEDRVKVCCTNCNQKRCVRYGQFTLSYCTDHSLNREKVNIQ